MQLKSAAFALVLTFGLAAPVKLKIRPNGEGAVCRATANNAGAANTCYCREETLGSGCDKAGYQVVCLAEELAPRAAAGGSSLEEDAWRLANPLD